MHFLVSQPKLKEARGFPSSTTVSHCVRPSPLGASATMQSDANSGVQALRISTPAHDSSIPALQTGKRASHLKSQGAAFGLRFLRVSVARTSSSTVTSRSRPLQGFTPRASPYHLWSVSRAEMAYPSWASILLQGPLPIASVPAYPLVPVPLRGVLPDCLTAKSQARRRPCCEQLIPLLRIPSSGSRPA